jgi:hypothetical protein
MNILTLSVITRIVNPAVTVHFIMVTVMPGHAVNIFRCRSHKIRVVFQSCDHTPGVAELLPQLRQSLSRGRGRPIPWVDNYACVEPWTRQAGFEQAFCCHIRTLAVHGTASVSRPWQAGGFQWPVARLREEQPAFRPQSCHH